jgi:hypothetical protein
MVVEILTENIYGYRNILLFKKKFDLLLNFLLSLVVMEHILVILAG